MAQKVDLSNPDFEGHLTKQSAWLKEWRKRYFVLKANQLHFMKTPTSNPHGTIDLKECLTVKSAEEKTGKRHCFEVATPDATYFMYADTEKQKDEWIGAIGRAIVKFSGAFSNPNADESSSDDDSDEDWILS